MNSSIKSDSNHHRSSYTTFLNELHASVRHRRVEATVTPLQQFSVRTKPVKTNLQVIIIIIFIFIYKVGYRI